MRLALAVLLCSALEAQTLPVAQRIAGRSFPSIFQAWSPATNLPQEDKLTTLARHDLVFCSTGLLGLAWNNPHQGLAGGFLPEGLAGARRMRQSLLEKNPHMVILLEIRYRDAHRRFLPEDHAWWKRDAQGKIEAGWEEGGFLKLDFANPEYQKQVAAQARAAVQSRVFDGVMLDWWNDDDTRLELVRQVRQAVGPIALILANANDRQTPRTAPYINGYFMECYRSQTPEHWQRIAATLAWAEENLREPRINCLETWYHTSRDDLHLMRAATTLALTLSNGYALFSDPNPLPTPDHLHNWYPFWNKTLGRPAARGARQMDGTIRREFENGAAVYNPMGNTAREVTFPAPRRSLATGKVSRTHTVPPADGDIFLKELLESP